MGMKCAGCGAEVANAIPATRLSEVTTEKNRLQTELTAKITELTNATTLANNASTQLAAAQAQVAELANQKTALRAGIVDDEGVTVATLLYGSLPAENRPAFEDWLKNPPKAVSAYMGQAPTAVPAPAVAQPPPATEPTTANAVPQKTAAPAPAATAPVTAFPALNNGVQPTQPAAWSPEAVASMSADEYREQRAAIKAQVLK